VVRHPGTVEGRRRTAAVAGLAAAALVAGGGCSTSEAVTTEDGGYASGDGSVVVLAEAERDEPLELAGTTLQGEAVDIADWRGSAVVLNTWYAACGPCGEEAPELAAAAERTAPDGVQFLGVNTRDGAAQGIAFEEQLGIPYPSIQERDGDALLSLRGTLSPASTPTTLVLDEQGRLAARVSGPVDEATLRGLLDEVGPA